MSESARSGAPQPSKEHRLARRGGRRSQPPSDAVGATLARNRTHALSLPNRCAHQGISGPARTPTPQLSHPRKKRRRWEGVDAAAPMRARSNDFVVLAAETNGLQALSCQKLTPVAFIEFEFTTRLNFHIGGCENLNKFRI